MLDPKAVILLFLPPLLLPLLFLPLPLLLQPRLPLPRLLLPLLLLLLPPSRDDQANTLKLLVEQNDEDLFTYFEVGGRDGRCPMKAWE